jgi:hypothetical protein
LFRGNLVQFDPVAGENGHPVFFDPSAGGAKIDSPLFTLEDQVATSVTS